MSLDDCVIGPDAADLAEVVPVPAVLPCPFCNERPERIEINNGIRLRCQNDQCPMEVYRAGIEAHEHWIVRDWNKRAPYSMFPEFAGEIIRRLGTVAMENSGDYDVGTKLLDVLIGAGVCQMVSEKQQELN